MTADYYTNNNCNGWLQYFYCHIYTLCIFLPVLLVMIFLVAEQRSYQLRGNLDQVEVEVQLAVQVQLVVQVQLANGLVVPWKILTNSRMVCFSFWS